MKIKTRYFVIMKIISLIILISMGYIGMKKISDSIRHVGAKQDKIFQQLDKMDVAGHHSSSVIPYKSYLGRFTATFYCDCPLCVGNKSVVRTATGYKPRNMRTIAVDPAMIPLHSIVYIKELGFFVAEDTGGHIKGKRVDIFVNNHQQAQKLGKKSVEIYILQ